MINSIVHKIKFWKYLVKISENSFRQLIYPGWRQLGPGPDQLYPMVYDSSNDGNCYDQCVRDMCQHDPFICITGCVRYCKNQVP